ncbi:hypothetical protein GCM10008018_63830 [Paenibacillus marchantiophytorum]|uniref:Uncharacterized protein n=1 Tax=Paenibacillus marchantiophytorum TaxID=1619310 RepID=A0ABQ1FFF3_9BACL|nr:hypothetical protein GCM10008018_63830 [Paenibacillus marchantiophytorum]
MLSTHGTCSPKADIWNLRILGLLLAGLRIKLSFPVKFKDMLTLIFLDLLHTILQSHNLCI